VPWNPLRRFKRALTRLRILAVRSDEGVFSLHDAVIKVDIGFQSGRPSHVAINHHGADEITTVLLWRRGPHWAL
jgi:hypothetical protein